MRAQLDGARLRARIYTELRQIMDPCSVGCGDPMNIVEMGLVKSVEINDGCVRIDLCLTSPTCMMLEHFVAEGKRAVAAIPGVSDVEIHGDVGLDWTPDRIEAGARTRRHRRLAVLDSRG